MQDKEPDKRQSRYGNLDDMLVDVDKLAKKGYAKQGNWSLGQTCGHLAEWMRFPMDGFPKPPLFVRMMFGVMKATGMTKRMSKKILAEGFSGGMPTAPETVPDATLTDADGIAQFRAVVERLKEHDGELHPSPLFGPMDKALHIRVSLLHAEHHLGYLKHR